MSFARGERVYFDFDSGIGEKVGPEENEAPPSLASAFVGDILERPVGATAAHPPVAPSSKENVNGFPVHKKRTPRVSAFKQRRAAKEQVAQADKSTAAPGAQRPNAANNAYEEKRQINEENRQRLAAMSETEIEEEKNELLANLSPALIQRLLGRANLDEGSNERDLGLGEEKPAVGTTETDNPKTGPVPDTASAKKVSFAEPDMQNAAPPPSSIPQPTIAPTKSSNPPVATPVSAEVEAASSLDPDTGSLHFPRPKQPPDLDPNDPAFLESLHEKYFPNLPYDPSSLSWMTPIDPADKSSPYHPSHTAFNASDLRFDFKGQLLAPNVARSIPVSKGLHHHADAPEAAGYTIPELAVMARSTVAAQRCVAFQALGRILYRLGQGEFGFEKVRQRTEGPVQVAKDPSAEAEVDEADIEVDMEDAASAMAAGLWHCMDEGRVVETLTEEAAREKGHLTARTFAQEALWNWRRGGGRRRQAI